jgi:hypothetical protein
MVLVFIFIEDEQTFATLAFMKNKLNNWSCPHLKTIVCIFAQKFYIQKYKPLSRGYYNLIKKSKLVLPLSKFYFFQDPSLK